MNLSILYSVITMLAVITLGAFCRRSKIFSDVQVDGLEVFLFKIIMPAYLFVEVYTCNLSDLLNKKYIFAYLITSLIMNILSLLIFVRRNSGVDVCLRLLAVSYVNSAKYALPIIVTLFKDPSSAIIANILQVIMIQPIFVILLNFFSRKQYSILQNIKDSISAPLVALPILGLILNLCQITIPYFIKDAVFKISNNASGLALFSIGLALGEGIKIRLLSSELLLMVSLKNFIHPILAIFVGLFTHLENYWFNSLIVISAAPTAFVVYFLAKQFSLEIDIIKRTIFLSTTISIISLLMIALFLPQ